MSSSLGEQLGFGPDATVAIVHADDIGMCHAANEGAFEALGAGPATCGSVMVPCPWFSEAAARARARPELDLGVHLTLNAEWELYRWGPVSGSNTVPSLVDARGHFFRTTAETMQRAKLDEVEVELRAQIERALDAGIDVTHIDAHMATALMPPHTEIYLRLAREFRVPAFLIRPRVGGSGDEEMRQLLEHAVADGIPLVDGFEADSLGFEPGSGLEHNRRRLERLRPGVNYLICHPARGGPELAGMTSDHHCRDFERSFYGGEQGRRALAEAGVQTVGMRALRDLMRGG